MVQINVSRRKHTNKLWISFFSSKDGMMRIFKKVWLTNWYYFLGWESDKICSVSGVRSSQYSKGGVTIICGQFSWEEPSLLKTCGKKKEDVSCFCHFMSARCFYLKSILCPFYSLYVKGIYIFMVDFYSKSSNSASSSSHCSL